MGVVIDLEERRAAFEARRLEQSRPARVEVLFDLSDPFSYLAAERVERSFEAVTWIPAAREVVRRGTVVVEREHAETRAHQLRMPLVWPERHPDRVPRAMRAASLASEVGCGAAFTLAAGRLAFCGGFDLDDPEILAEAAAAAGLGLDACLRAAGDRRRDAGIIAAGALSADGADRLPALSVGGLLFSGEERIAEAAAAARRCLGSSSGRSPAPSTNSPTARLQARRRGGDRRGVHAPRRPPRLRDRGDRRKGSRRSTDSGRTA